MICFIALLFLKAVLFWVRTFQIYFIIFPRSNVKHLTLKFMKFKNHLQSVQNKWLDYLTYIFLNKLKDKEHNTLHTLYFSLHNLEPHAVLFFLKHNIEAFKRYLRVWSSE